MDTGLGEIAPISKTAAELLKQHKIQEQMSVFTTGEIVSVKSSKFIIAYIDRNTLVLNILPQQT